jgi:hypothetical protein
VNSRGIWKSLVKIVLSILFGGILYACWMAAFLLIPRTDNSVLEIILWLLAPLFTATGFAVGVLVGDRLSRVSGGHFFRIFRWPLIGCTLGGGLVYWFGPMLIVFGMFLGGAISIALREVVAFYRSGRVPSPLP